MSKPHDSEPGERATAKHVAEVVIRGILPEDEAAMTRFHQTLSPESVYTRYFNVLKLSRRRREALKACGGRVGGGGAGRERRPPGSRQLSWQNCSNPSQVVSRSLAHRRPSDSSYAVAGANRQHSHCTKTKM